ncbi:hypothetical protein LX32DRAFT_228843 [Colletotrichum zoysiae]|uniref:Uncharacterized protein n=1 Tax=Colletotrichum zoysiae TaxID=1216348 RepID=A0AAD9H5G4_9PEZI|nr:hypothetical protein LX32DRAFT_228843 [Colletotrichum zoysiae]
MGAIGVPVPSRVPRADGVSVLEAAAVRYRLKKSLGISQLSQVNLGGGGSFFLLFFFF